MGQNVNSWWTWWGVCGCQLQILVTFLKVCSLKFRKVWQVQGTAPKDCKLWRLSRSLEKRENDRWWWRGQTVKDFFSVRSLIPSTDWKRTGTANTHGGTTAKKWGPGGRKTRKEQGWGSALNEERSFLWDKQVRGQRPQWAGVWLQVGSWVPDRWGFPRKQKTREPDKHLGLRRKRILFKTLPRKQNQRSENWQQCQLGQDTQPQSPWWRGHPQQHWTWNTRQDSENHTTPTLTFLVCILTRTITLIWNEMCQRHRQSLTWPQPPNRPTSLTPTWDPGFSHINPVQPEREILLNNPLKKGTLIWTPKIMR